VRSNSDRPRIGLQRSIGPSAGHVGGARPAANDCYLRNETADVKPPLPPSRRPMGRKIARGLSTPALAAFNISLVEPRTTLGVVR
jgi:hypothetical protein